MAETERNREEIARSLRIVEDTLSNRTHRRIDERLFVVRQGSAYVMIAVQPFGTERAIVRLAAQLVSGIDMTGDLARRLLKINARLRFGAFGYQEQGKVVTLSHSILGGETLDYEELQTTLEDLALLADEFDDRLVVAGGGCRMSDLLQEDMFTRASHPPPPGDETMEWDDRS